MKFVTAYTTKRNGGSPPARGAWIEIARFLRCPVPVRSPPARGAWIEILARLTKNCK